MSNKILKKIQLKESIREKIILELFEIREMINGSFHHLKVRCGKSHCKCMKTDDYRHPHQRIKWKINGKPISRAVPKEDVSLIEEINGNFRKFKLLKRKLNKLETEIKELLDRYEKEVIASTQKLRPYLVIQ